MCSSLQCRNRCLILVREIPLVALWCLHRTHARNQQPVVSTHDEEKLSENVSWDRDRRLETGAMVDRDPRLHPVSSSYCGSSDRVCQSEYSPVPVAHISVTVRDGALDSPGWDCSRCLYFLFYTSSLSGFRCVFIVLVWVYPRCAPFAHAISFIGSVVLGWDDGWFTSEYVFLRTADHA